MLLMQIIHTKSPYICYGVKKTGLVFCKSKAKSLAFKDTQIDPLLFLVTSCFRVFYYLIGKRKRSSQYVCTMISEDTTLEIVFYDLSFRNLFKRAQPHPHTPNIRTHHTHTHTPHTHTTHTNTPISSQVSFTHSLNAWGKLYHHAGLKLLMSVIPLIMPITYFCWPTWYNVKAWQLDAFCHRP